MSNKTVQIDSSWYAYLKDEFEKDYFKALKQFLLEEKSKFIIYPPSSQIFAAFDTTPFDNVKVVILGQDPYHGEHQAHGLCFSVPQDVKIPPSLLNIFKELNTDVNKPIATNGNLEHWAKQGVFLLNATLTVRANCAGSHQNKGWETFTDKVISILNENKDKLVFVLWGRYAANKEKLIDTSKHLILKAAHPSPLSAYNGFFGCKHFSKINNYLQQNKKTEILW